MDVPLRSRTGPPSLLLAPEPAAECRGIRAGRLNLAPQNAHNMYVCMYACMYVYNLYMYVPTYVHSIHIYIYVCDYLLIRLAKILCYVCLHTDIARTEN